jgi:histidinol-phosphate aminotransferase
MTPRGETAQVAENVLRHIKPAVRKVAAYTLSARRAPVKLNQNENPFDVPEALKRRVIEQALRRPWSRYPDFDPQELLHALARFSGWRADGILAGNGSNELIEALLLVTVGEGTRVVIPEPTFTLYALLTGMLGGRAVRVPLGEDFAYDGALLARARREVDAPVTVVCSPNNPTGGLLPADDLRRLCEESDGLVVVDEAYHEFSRQSAVPLLAEHPNLIVLRTFSKAMGLAGLRLGYLLASPEIVREVNKARLPYNLNFFSQAAALAVLEEAPAFGEAVGRLIAMRDQLALDLATVPGVRVFPSRANFLLFELAEAEPRRVFEALHAKGVLVRDVSAYPRLQRCLRVTVGSEDENAAFLGALRAVLGAS